MIEQLNRWMNVVIGGGTWTVLGLLLGLMVIALLIGRFSKRKRRSARK